MRDEPGPLTVAALTQTAGVNRATFYDHFESPQDVLLGVLAEDLDALRESDDALRKDPGLSRTAILRTALLGVVEHVRRFEPIYRRSLSNPADGVTHHALSSHFAESVRRILDRQDPPPPGLHLPIAAEFIAHALVGALEVWLAAPDLSEEELVDGILGCMPDWWASLR
ncbi:TetR/AcrR family transcriptional regulator [Gulosibacter sp. 10]|uniref:TetR/AcrR family transcriptional regulator n=1 Tax=Gulosibacter sp. 10 TaxID=1255570 RepID=UPI00097F5F87|nr:hypothetical protein FM112_08250 [Gulosibacter sp. 10]